MKRSSSPTEGIRLSSQQPLYLTFRDEAEGDAYCRRLEALLDRGVVPDELKQRAGAIVTLTDAIAEYRDKVAVPRSDGKLLSLQIQRIGTTRISTVDFGWVEKWVAEMKRVQGLAPSTIRHHVGAPARCLDWLARRHGDTFPGNPIRLLPKGYSPYSDSDGEAAIANGKVPREDTERDRRLQSGEEDRIRAILSGAKPEGKQRALWWGVEGDRSLPHRGVRAGRKWRPTRVSAPRSESARHRPEHLLRQIAAARHRIGADRLFFGLKQLWPLSARCLNARHQVGGSPST